MTWSYIAGFFDGEGSIVRNKRGFRIMISQTNKGVLEKIKKFTKSGYVIEVTKRKAHWKDSWLYYIAKQKDVYKFLTTVFPFLTVKKENASKAIPQLKTFLQKKKQKEKRLQERIKISKKLRKKGLSYRKIGKILGIDFGYVRRLTLK